MASLTGDDDADQAGRTPAEVWPPDLAEAAQAALRRVAAGDRPVPQTAHAIATGAGAATASSRCATGRSPGSRPADGDVSGVAAIAVDVTPQHQAAEAVRRSEERYRSLVQAGRPGGVGDQARRRDRRGLA